MRNQFDQQMERIERQLAIHKSKNKPNPPPQNKNHPAKNSINLEDGLINFPQNSYPFTNKANKPNTICRTKLNGDVPNNKLKKIINLSHPNLISMQKITRGHSKNIQGYQSELYFSFYYQFVPFSLKHIVANDGKSNELMQAISSINLGKTLYSLSEYLERQNIYNQFNLDDIGVKQNTTLKVYISPRIICFENHISTRKTVNASIQRIVAWWDTVIASIQPLHPKRSSLIRPIFNQFQHKKEDQNKSKQSSFIQKQQSQIMGSQDPKQLIVRNNPLKNSRNSQVSEHSLKSSLHIDKMKKIDQKIKLIKQRLKEKAKKKHRISDTINNKLNDKINHLFDGHLKKKHSLQENNRTAQGYKQTIQQNINCINIYNNHPPKQQPTQAYSPIKIQKMSSQPLYSYTITPKQSSKYKIMNNIAMQHLSFEPEDFRNSNEDLSVDTYEMQLQDEAEPEKAVDHYRNTLCPPVQREISQKNYRINIQYQDKTNKIHQNQVANRSVTQSAGPLQFQNFVTKFIKPQFLSKKSKIYEDPGEYQSQNSKSISNTKKHCQLFEAGKSVNSFTQKSSSLKNNTKQDQFKFVGEEKKLSKQPQIQFSSQDQIYRMTSDQILLGGSKLSHKSNHYLKRKRTLDCAQLGERVKLVLQKTKNTIALLNKAKNAKSIANKF